MSFSQRETKNTNNNATFLIDASDVQMSPSFFPSETFPDNAELIKCQATQESMNANPNAEKSPVEEEVYSSETGYDFSNKLFDLNAVLSGSRVSQMTKTFADVDALQKLLEEKEKDLELAARIGQQLLEQNQTLRERVASLEAENKESVESITQLKHELNFKSSLLELYNDSNESAEPSKAGTPVGAMSCIATVLERRLQLLEVENQSLRAEAMQMAEDVEKTEAQEKYLVEDAITKLNESNRSLAKLTDEIQRKSEEARVQQEELTSLEEELKVFQEANRGIVDENNELRKVVEVLSQNQNQLMTELADLKDNYVEVVSILKETQEQLRDAQRQKEEGADVVTVFDSLAYEIDSSVARYRRSSDYFRRTFDTVRCANSKLSNSNPPSLNSSALISTSAAICSSGLPSFESSSSGSHELVNSNFNSLLLESGLGSSLCYSPGNSTPGGTWRFPEKLQIVKPLEGSSTLQAWSALATPHLGNLLDKRPGVQTRVERNIDGIGANTLLALPSEPCGSNLTVSTSAVFTFVTTSSFHDRPITTTSSARLSSAASTSSLSSLHSVSNCQSPAPSISTFCSDKDQPRTGSSTPLTTFYESGDYLKCETPQNSPLDGNSRPMSPSHRGGGDSEIAKGNTMKTLFGVYDSLCSKLNPSRTNNCSASSQKYDLTTKLGRLELSFESSRFQAPPKPGTGALDKILLEPD